MCAMKPVGIEDQKGRRAVIVAHTERLILRHVVHTDAAFILGLMNEPAYHANIGDRGLRSIEDAEGYCRSVLMTFYRDNGFGLYLVCLRVGDGQEGEAIGFCGLVNRDGLDGVDLGYAIHSRHQRQGYATEACGAVLDHARDEIGLPELLAIVGKQNSTSIHLLKKLGFSLQGDFTYPDSGDVLNLFKLQFATI